jgi:hypothetical protein
MLRAISVASSQFAVLSALRNRNTIRKRTFD